MPCSSLPLAHKAHPSSNSCKIRTVSPFEIGSSSGNEGMNLDFTIALLGGGIVPGLIPALFHDALGIANGVAMAPDWLNCMPDDWGASLYVSEAGSKVLASRGLLIHVDTRERRRCMKRFRSKIRATATSTRTTAMTMPAMAPAGKVCLDTAPLSEAEAEEVMADADGNGGVVDDSNEDELADVDTATAEPEDDDDVVDDIEEVDELVMVAVVDSDGALDAVEDSALVIVIVVIGTALLVYSSSSRGTCGSGDRFRCRTRSAGRCC